MNVFAKATRVSLRFESPVGPLTTEQLWELPLSRPATKLDRSRPLDLRTVSATAVKDLRSFGESESLVPEEPRTPGRDLAELRVEVLRVIIETKVQEQAENTQRAIKVAERRRLQEALAVQDEKALAGMSRDEILSKLAALDA